MPPPGKRYLGFHEPTIVSTSPQGWTPGQMAGIARAAGAEISRFTIDWTFVEPLQDSWDEHEWARYERAYRALKRRGITPLIGLSTAPPWARDLGAPTLCGPSPRCTYPPRPAMYGEWREFAAEVARRFPGAAAVEIWNEPNLAGFWKPSPEPERYAALVAAAYDAIKLEAPQIEVLAGALAATERTKVDGLGTVTTMRMRDFLRRAYQADPSIAGHMDGLSFHQVSQDHQFGPETQMALGFGAVRAVRGKHDPRRTPIWITEFSLSTTGGSRLKLEAQADALLRAYRKLMTMKDVRAMVIHTLADRLELPRPHPGHGVGLISAWDPFTPKPSFCAFAGRVAGRSPGACRSIREARVSPCTRSLSSLTGRILAATGDGRATLKRRHRRQSTGCVPCVRRHTILVRALAAADGRQAGVIRRALARLERRCQPCERRLVTLQRRHARVIRTLRLDVLNRHERVRRGCR